MFDWVIEMTESFGYISIFMMMALENIFPPIPSEVILLFSGFMTTYTNVSALGVLITATTGSVVGAIILYGVGKLVPINRLEVILDKWGSILRFTKEDLQKANEWFGKFGYLAVFLCRMIPIVRSLISIPAGMSHMHFGVFLLFTMMGTIIWNSLLIALGVALGDAWDKVLYYIGIYSMIVYVVIGIGVVFFLGMFVFRKSQ